MSVIAYVRRNDGGDEQQHHDIVVLGIDLLYEDRGNSPDIPRIPGWLSAHFRLSKARSNEIRPPPTG